MLNSNVPVCPWFCNYSWLAPGLWALNPPKLAAPKPQFTHLGSAPSGGTCCAFCHIRSEYIHANTPAHALSEALFLGIGSPWLPGAPPCLCSCAPELHLFHVGMSSGLKEEHTMALPTMPHLQAPTQGQRNNQPIRHCQAPAPADNHRLLSRRKIGETTISCLT